MTARTRYRDTGSRSFRAPPAPGGSGWGPASGSAVPWSGRYGSGSWETRRSRRRRRLPLQLRPVVAAASGGIPEAARGADLLLAVVGVSTAPTADDVYDLAATAGRGTLRHASPTVRCRRSSRPARA